MITGIVYIKVSYREKLDNSSLDIIIGELLITERNCY